MGLDIPTTVAATPPPLDVGRDALFLDVDGTLLDIAPRPGDVAVEEGLPEVLARLCERLDGALALVTGRDIATIDRLFVGSGFAIAGVHGAELRLVSGETRHRPPHPALAGIKSRLAAWVAERPGLLLEDKERAVAVHFRAQPEAEEEVERHLRAILADAGPGLTLQPGKMVREIRPADADKGGALRALMDLAPFCGRRPVMIGDDWTDEPAFAAARAAGGLGYRVGLADRPTAAEGFFEDPPAVRRWLRAQA
jgi:trehalose 6-phosphate phosphatase